MLDYANRRASVGRASAGATDLSDGWSNYIPSIFYRSLEIDGEVRLELFIVQSAVFTNTDD